MFVYLQKEAEMLTVLTLSDCKSEFEVANLFTVLDSTGIRVMEYEYTFLEYKMQKKIVFKIHNMSNCTATVLHMMIRIQLYYWNILIIRLWREGRGRDPWCCLFCTAQQLSTLYTGYLFNFIFPVFIPFSLFTMPPLPYTLHSPHLSHSTTRVPFVVVVVSVCRAQSFEFASGLIKYWSIYLFT